MAVAHLRIVSEPMDCRVFVLCTLINVTPCCLGEEDMHGYDLSRLRKPVGPDSPEAAPYRLGQAPPEAYPRTREELPRTGMPLHFETSYSSAHS